MQNVSESPEDYHKKAKTSFILGFIGLVTWLIPIIGIPVSIYGLVCGIKGWHSSKHTQAVVGVTLAIVSLVFGVMNMTIGAYLGATGQLF